MKKVAIQGIPGAFHEIAARSYFSPEHIEIVPCRTFPGLFSMVAADKSMFGISAVENSLAGSILTNLTLLKDSGLTIIGECKLRISMNMMALPGQTAGEIGEVYSHPVALMQCGEYFSRHPWMKVSESDDTAMSAMDISIKRARGKGVIASSLAARHYNLNIIDAGIETNKRNFTRFFILSGNSDCSPLKEVEDAGTGKATLVFTLRHKQGMLSEVLTMLAAHGCNLMMIQSNPVIGHEWEYLFYIDLVFSHYSLFGGAMDKMQTMCNDLKILGIYHEGRVYSEEEAPLYETIDTEQIIKQWNS
ncbi:MAG: prephenate dehydratase [Bacteroidales bacterium]|nr:prephenate dehydratase [Bacteroidales bacterium]